MLGSICESRLYNTTFVLLGVSSLFLHVGLSLPLLRMSSKSTSLGPGFCVLRRRQYNMICWKLDLIFGFFVFPGSLFGQMESINEADVL